MKSCATASWGLALADLQREWGWCSRSRARGCAAVRTLEKPLHAEPRAGEKVQRTAADAGRPCGCGEQEALAQQGAVRPCGGGPERSRNSSPGCSSSLRCGAPKAAPRCDSPGGADARRQSRNCRVDAARCWAAGASAPLSWAGKDYVLGESSSCYAPA